MNRDLLVNFMLKATAAERSFGLKEFEAVFGSNTGAHLYDKYKNKCGGSLLSLYGLLDRENCELLVNAIIEL